LTGKQERNGITADAGHDTGQPGPMPDVPIGAAEAAGNGRHGDQSVFTAPSGGSVSFDWEAGLAIGELPGEA
jgi:hypothetical protein